MANVEALGMAAGAISKAIGDIYRGQLSATQEKPGLESAATSNLARQQEMSRNMMRFPLEMAETRQKIGLGGYALEEAPLKIAHLKQTMEGQGLDNQLKGIQVKSTGDVYNQTIQSREAVRRYLLENKDKPGNEWMGAYVANPDAFLEMWGKRQIEEIKADYKRPSFDQVLGVLAQKKASGKPLTPQEEQVYRQGIEWKMKSAGGVTPAMSMRSQASLYKEADKSWDQTFQTMFGKDFTKVPGQTQQQKNLSILYYKNQSMQQIYDADPSFAMANVKRPNDMARPPWVAEYEAKALQPPFNLTSPSTWFGGRGIPWLAPGQGAAPQPQAPAPAPAGKQKITREQYEEGIRNGWPKEEIERNFEVGP